MFGGRLPFFFFGGGEGGGTKHKPENKNGTPTSPLEFMELMIFHCWHFGSDSLRQGASGLDNLFCLPE